MQRRSIWSYTAFQIPFVLFVICLITAFLFWLLEVGRPSVAVGILMDLSGSTYEPKRFNAPGTIMAQEVDAVNLYLERNAQLKSRPNQIKIYGFAGDKSLPITNSYESDSEKTKTEFSLALASPKFPDVLLPEGPTKVDVALKKIVGELKPINQYCREILLVSDAGAIVDDPSAVASDASANQVRINGITFGGVSEGIEEIAKATGGVYLFGDVGLLGTFFRDKIFTRFNTNHGLIIVALGAAWFMLMWALVIPLDKMVFQGAFRMQMGLAGKLAVFNALFWTAATPLIVWGIINTFGLSIVHSC